MKNRMMMLLTCGLVLAFFANCGKDDEHKGGPIEMSGACFLMQRQTMNQWGQQIQQPYGGTCSYPYQQAANAGFTSANGGGLTYTAGAMGGMACSGSQSQAYSPSKGLGCVDNTRITLSGQPVIFDLNPGTGNFSPISAPNPYFMYQNQQYGNQLPYGSMGMSNNGILPMTSSQVFRVCEVNESCASGQTCRSPYGPMSGFAQIGICYFN